MRLSKLIIFFFIIISFSLGQIVLAAPTPVIIQQVKCIPGQPAFVMWNGTGFLCIPLPIGVTLVGNVLNIQANVPVYTPAAQVETISLTSLPSTATTITYTTAQTPISGVLFYTYNSTNLLLGSFGFVIFTGQPITFTLPVGWLNTDTISISYQSK